MKNFSIFIFLGALFFNGIALAEIDPILKGDFNSMLFLKHAQVQPYPNNRQYVFEVCSSSHGATQIYQTSLIVNTNQYIFDGESVFTIHAFDPVTNKISPKMVTPILDVTFTGLKEAELQISFKSGHISAEQCKSFLIKMPVGPVILHFGKNTAWSDGPGRILNHGATISTAPKIIN